MREGGSGQAVREHERGEERRQKWLQGMGSLFKTQIKHPEQRRQQKLNLNDKLLPLY